MHGARQVARTATQHLGSLVVNEFLTVVSTIDRERRGRGEATCGSAVARDGSRGGPEDGAGMVGRTPCPAVRPVAVVRSGFESLAVVSPPKRGLPRGDRKSTRLNSSHVKISYAVFCLQKKHTDKSEATCA